MSKANPPRVLKPGDEETHACGLMATQVDHIWPVKLATGRERDDELQALCHRHHSRKTQLYDRGVERR